MATDLNPAEKEEKEVERLIGRKPAPSRKRSKKSGPKHDNRRRRMKVDDSDLDSFDSDLSMSQKRRLSMAERVSESFRASYGAGPDREMSVKTATYHGVVDQKHPDGPGPGWRSHDRRYFGKQHYDSIVASAKSILKEDWLKYGWDGAAEDAPVRAALDLAIHTADGSLYQSKIDVETYNMLLARVQGDKTDQFSETMLPNTEASPRSASAMSNAFQNLLRTASEIRKTDPRAALEIVKSIRTLAADGVVPPLEKVSLASLLPSVQKIAAAGDMDEFVSAFRSLSDSVKAQHGRTANDIPGLEHLEDMSEDDVQSFLDKQKGSADALEKSISSEDLEGFMKGLDSLFQDVGNAAKNVKTGSVRVNISSLLRIAADVPEARAALTPFLVAAKKKSDKAKAKKTSQKKSEKPKDEPKDNKAKKGPPKKGAPPFGGKKALPFGKGKSKKASIEIETGDLDW